MDWQQTFDGLELHEDALTDDEIEPVATFDEDALVPDRDGALAFEGDTTFRKLGAQASLVC